MESSSTFSAKIASDLIRFASEKGADAGPLYRELGIEERYLNRDDIRVPAGKMAKVWDLAHKQSNDSFLAFHMGVEFAYSARDTHLMIMQSSQTVQEAFEQGMRYSEIVANALELEMGCDAENFFMDYMPRADWLKAPVDVVRDSLAVSLVTNMISLQMCVGKFIAPSILEFQFSQPGNVNEFLAVFNASIKFDRPHNRIGFPADVSQMPISTSDNGLLGSLKRYGDELKTRIWPQDEIIQQVRDIIVDTLTSQSVPSLDSTASRLNVSSRTLQRKLSTVSSNFQVELDEVRKALASRYVDSNDKSLSEISYLLGYANTTSFIRAYKRWYGTTPGQLSKTG